MYNILVISMEWNQTNKYTNDILLNGNKMETIYIHTFPRHAKCFLFFLGGFSNIDFYCVKHNTSKGNYFYFLVLQKTGATF